MLVFSLHTLLTMHGQKNLKLVVGCCYMVCLSGDDGMLVTLSTAA